jgi:MoxR-like ATPase
MTAIDYSLSNNSRYAGLDFVDTSNEEKKFLTIAENPGNIRLVGETGTGKSTLVHHVAKKHEWKVYQYSLTQETTRYDLLAERTLENGTSGVNEGIVLLWLKEKADKGKKVVLFLDEYNYARPECKSFVNQLADFRRSIWVPELKQEFTRSDDHVMVIAMNPHEKVAYGGTVEENLAQVRRFETIRLDWLRIDQETKIVKAYCSPTAEGYAFARKMSEWANKIRRNYRNNNLTAVLTTENLKTYGSWHKEGSLVEKEIVEIALGLFPEEERDGVNRLWEAKEDIDLGAKTTKRGGDDN